jgi:hypothetical protein
MSWAGVTLALYGRVLRRATVAMRRNWPVAGVLFVYSAIMSAATALAMLLGILGGFLVSAVWAACVGSFLYLIEMIVRTGRVSLADLRRSAGAYLGDVLGVAFVVWVVFALAGPMLRGTPQGALILFLAESYAFVTENWIEWFPATLVLAGAVYAIATMPLAGVAAYLGRAAVAVLVTFMMVVRGLLFLELHGSSRRSRAFRHRMEA